MKSEKERLRAHEIISAATKVFPVHYADMIIQRFPDYYDGDPSARDKIRNVYNLRVINGEILDQIELLTNELKSS